MVEQLAVGSAAMVCPQEAQAAGWMIDPVMQVRYMGNPVQKTEGLNQHQASEQAQQGATERRQTQGERHAANSVHHQTIMPQPDQHLLGNASGAAQGFYDRTMAKISFLQCLPLKIAIKQTPFLAILYLSLTNRSKHFFIL